MEEFKMKMVRKGQIMNYFNNRNSQIQISLAVGIMAAIAYIVAPVLWITSTNQSTAVEQSQQNSDIKQLQQNYTELKTSNDRLNKAMDKLLFKAGIDPSTVK